MQTYSEVEAQMDAEISARPELTGLTDSNASEWKIWKSLFIYASLSLQFLWDSFKSEILGLIKQEKIARPEWYKLKSLEFQFGDPIFNDDGILTYATIDTTKRIIKQAAAVANNTLVVIKVATEDGVLTTEERAAFLDYWEVMKPFTQPLQIVSAEPDKVKAVLTVYFDGKLTDAAIEAATETAIDDYLLNKIEFNGSFNINGFRDTINAAIRALSPENDVQITSVEIRPDTGTFTNVAYKYVPHSGRYKFGTPDDAIVLDRSTINYVRI